MALFGKKNIPTEEQTEAQAEELASQPEKARRFFDHAKTVHEATNYEYAMQSWLRGLIFDPASMEGLEGFFRSAAAFLNDNPKGKISKETAKTFEGRSPAEKYALALLAAGIRPLDAPAVIRAVEMAQKLGQDEVAYRLAERALSVGQAKPRKDVFLKIMRVCQAMNVFDLAVRAGELARQLDPEDGPLAAEVLNMSARATMDRGGFDDTGTEGGYRRNIRDSEKQRQLEEEERIVKSEDVKDRLVRTSAEDYQSRPGDLPTIKKYIKALLDRGRPEDEKLALTIANKAHEETRQFSFRQTAGEITLRIARRALLHYRESAEADPDDSAAREDYEKANRKFLEMEVDLLVKQVEAYPTDLGYKFELGKRCVQLERYEEAIGLFQEAKADPKNRGTALSMLAQSFERIGWNDEAIQTYRSALETRSDESGDLVMSLRYGLMSALQAKAAEARDIASAEEAEKLASEIAIQKIGYRDIRDRRQQLKDLLAELRG